ncbi:MAG: hypothetical protein IT310_03210 [Anaerolineales bacterium]|nr:hypothetical protein [Anaerolineales bacterium]
MEDKMNAIDAADEAEWNRVQSALDLRAVLAAQARQASQNQHMDDKMSAIDAADEAGWVAGPIAQQTESWWDKAVDFAQTSLFVPVQELIQTASDTKIRPVQGGGTLATSAPLDDDPPWLQKIQEIKRKIADAIFADNDQPPTILDRLFNNEWNESRQDLVEALDQAQGDKTYSYSEKFLGLDWWNSDLSVDQLIALQGYIKSGTVSWDDTLASIDSLQTYKGYNNAQMISLLRELYYPDALDNFILGAQGLDSSLFKVSGDKNQVAENDAEFSRALMLLTTQGEQYAEPLVIIQHPQGYSETGEFEFDHIVAALDGQFHSSKNGYIFSDELDNENRPLWLGLIGTNPFSGELESVKNLIAKASFWWLKTDSKTMRSVPEVTWRGDLAGSAAKAYETSNAEDGYEIEMPLSDFEGDILGMVLAHNNAIDPDGKDLANELSDALAADSPYVTQKYSYFVDAVGLDLDDGVISNESAQQFLDDNYELVSDLGTGFYALQNLDPLSLLSSNQTTMHDFSEEQIKHFLQQLQEGIQIEVVK